MDMLLTSYMILEQAEQILCNFENEFYTEKELRYDLGKYCVIRSVLRKQYGMECLMSEIADIVTSQGVIVFDNALETDIKVPTLQIERSTKRQTTWSIFIKEFSKILSIVERRFNNPVCC